MTIDGVSNSKLKKRDLKYIVAQKAWRIYGLFWDTDET